MTKLTLVQAAASTDHRQREHLLAQLVVSDGLADPVRADDVLEHELAVLRAPQLVIRGPEVAVEQAPPRELLRHVFDKLLHARLVTARRELHQSTTQFARDSSVVATAAALLVGGRVAHRQRVDELNIDDRILGAEHVGQP